MTSEVDRTSRTAVTEIMMTMAQLKLVLCVVRDSNAINRIFNCQYSFRIHIFCASCVLCSMLFIKPILIVSFQTFQKSVRTETDLNRYLIVFIAAV